MELYPPPVRVHEIRYGRADSPRFTRTHTDGFGDVIREERSGVNGATLVTAQRTRLSGLTLATNSLTITTDIRGNENIVRNILAPAIQSSFEITRTPGILNVATNWYTDGVTVSNISHSGVMTQIRHDALRREVARIDGRGNVTRTVYDAYGRVAAIIDALTNATTYAYDANNQLLQVCNATPTNVISQYGYTYDAARRRVACMLSALRAVEMPQVKVL